MKNLILAILLFSTTTHAFASIDSVQKVGVKVVKDDDNLALILKGEYVIEGAPIYPCKINGKTKTCYLLRKAEKTQPKIDAATGIKTGK